ncbi:MAG TPA: CapA family protein [Pyrinomonadaceae bacterium]|nr:CapA family protein [Pyrinomonadaceae bacterium]
MAQPTTIILAGDVMLGRGVNSYLLRAGPAYPWGNTHPTLSAADLTIINLECVIARGGRPWSRWPKVFHFKADPIAITSLHLAGIDCVTLANNHVLDFEEEALTEMLALLENAKIKHPGAGPNLNEAMQPAVLETSGLKVAVVAFTDNEPGWAASANKAGTNYIEVSLAEESLNVVKESIIKSRMAGADLVIFSIHWGPNMAERPSPLFQQFAHAVIDAGADVLHGHSAHIFQGIEIYGGKPIIYDAGDFVDDYSVDPVLRNDFGLLFRLLVEEKQVKHLELLPVFISKCQVNVAVGSHRLAILERITNLSREMGTTISSSAQRLWVDCALSRGHAQTG